jgi:hypothetical protein
MSGPLQLDYATITLARPGTQLGEPPMHTVIRQNQESGAGPYERKELPLGLVGVILGVAVCMGLLAWWINRASARRPSAEVRAFSRLARKLRLGRAGRRIAQDLAERAEIAPVSLLASPSALRAAMAQVESGEWSSRRGWARLVGLADGATPTDG